MRQVMDTVSHAHASRDPILLEHALDRFGAQCEAKWLGRHGLKNYSSQFLEHGYYIAPIPFDVTEILKGYFVAENEAPINSSSSREDYFNAGLEAAVALQMNKQNIYYDRPSQDVVATLEGYFDTIKDDIEQQLGHCWAVTNVRAWSVKPNVDYGPNIWHADGFSRYVRKFLIFVKPPNEEAGTTEISTRKNDFMDVEASTPACVLYDANVLYHRGRSPKETERPMIEVTLVPAETTSIECVFAGQLGRVPLDLAHDVAAEMANQRYTTQPSNVLRFPSRKQISKALPAAVSGIRKTLKKKLGLSKTERKRPAVTNLTARLNLGGGRRWQHRGWINLEGVAGPKNPYPFLFSKDVVLPVPSSSIQLAYSSHCLEHLDDATVKRVLVEARRAISVDGTLILKLPDCEEVLQRWRERDESYFRETWRLHKVSPTWASRGVDDTIDARAAYIFCGFWNQAFGHNFIGKHNRKAADPNAYHGPPLQAQAMAKDLITLDSPHEIAARLRQAVVDNEDDYTFNHQNGWSREELRTLLAECGFRVTSFDTKEIIRNHNDVPGIELMEDMSVYCLAVPE